MAASASGSMNLALHTQALATNPAAPSTLSIRVLEAWDDRCKSLAQEERKMFESLACTGLHEYLEKLSSACQRHQDESYTFRVLARLEPIYKLVELFLPAASVASQAYPNPSCLVIGGVVAVVEATSRLQDYQKLAIQMLSRMGKKTEIIREYETGLFKDDEKVQTALVKVYGDIIIFCRDAVRILTSNSSGNKIEAKVKGLRLILFRDFRSQLGKQVEDFEADLDHLQELTNVSYQKRLQQLLDSYDKRGKDFDNLLEAHREEFRRRDDVLAQLVQMDQSLRQKHEDRKKLENHMRCLRWLSTLSFEDLYDRRCREHLEGTGTWLLESAVYKAWKTKAKSDLLWIRGKPGCGKSFLAAVAITDLQCEEDSETACAYALCRRDHESVETVSTLLGALAKQLIRQRGSVNRELENAYIQAEPTEPPSVSTVSKILRSAILGFRRVYLIVDALDELMEKERVRLLEELLPLIHDIADVSISILVLSRPDWEVDKKLKLTWTPIQPDLGNNEEDLKTYIYSCFPEDTEQPIRDICLEKAGGMFLWVKLVHQSVQTPLTKKQRENRIKDLPRDLDSMYGVIMDEIWSQYPDTRLMAIAVLVWATHAFRPLLVRQMLDAIGDYDDVRKVAKIETLGTGDHLVAICKNLVYVDKDGYISLIHESVRNYLENINPQASPPLLEYQRQRDQAHNIMAGVCLTYLSLEDFDEGPVQTMSGLAVLAAIYPFMAYAAEFWGKHAARGMSDTLSEQIAQFLDSPPRRELSMQVSMFDANNPDSFWNFTNSSTCFHVLALFGLRQVASDLMRREPILNRPDGSGRTPLKYALLNSHRDMTLWLLQQSQELSDFSLDKEDLNLAIYLAATYGWVDVLERLVEADNTLIDAKLAGAAGSPLITACDAGEAATAVALIRLHANVNAIDETSVNPLMTAAGSGLTAVMEMLLERNADPNAVDQDGYAALHFAASKDNSAAIAILIRRGANPTVREQLDLQTPLHIAATVQTAGAVRELHRLCPRLDLNVKTKQGYTPLHMTAWHDCSKAAEALLQLGCSKDETDESGRTALAIAVQKNATQTVTALMKGGCDPFLTTKDGDTPLHIAVDNANAAAMNAILTNLHKSKWRSLLSIVNKEGECPLHRAIMGGSVQIVGALLSAGADGTAEGYLGSRPLHCATHTNNRPLSRMLLSHTRDVNPRNNGQDTPLHFAARAGNVDFLQQYVQDCADFGLVPDFGATNSSGRTAFFIAVENGQQDVAEYLYSKTPPDALAKVGGDSLPIHMAAWNGIESMAQKLLEHNASDARGYFGRTPLHCAALRGHVKIVRLLAEKSPASLNVPDNEGMTPIFVALRNGHSEVSMFLLEQPINLDCRDEFGRTLLHFAAIAGDIPVVRRLLELGCDGCAVDYMGQSSFHRAVMADNIEMVRLMIAAGFDHTGTPDNLGTYCDGMAAEIGSLSMLRELHRLNAPFGTPNFPGHNAAHYAANGGHTEVLGFLAECSVDLRLRSTEGATPLMMAASQGHPETVKYLLQRIPEDINLITTWNLETALTSAVASGCDKVAKVLYANGADILHRDAHGMNALELSHALDPLAETSLEAVLLACLDLTSGSKRDVLLRTTRHCAQTLLEERDLSLPGELWYRVSRLDSLAKALRLLGDLDLAKICVLENYWPAKLSMIQATPLCDVCGIDYMRQNIYTCTTCHEHRHLCSECYEDYVRAGKKPPKALTECLKLEARLQPVRAATANILDLIQVWQALNYFELGAVFLSEMQTQYDEWEQKYNSKKRYSATFRPGQEYLKLVKDFGDLCVSVARNSGVGEHHLKQAEQLYRAYDKHRVTYRADHERIVLTCDGHEFYAVTAEEHQKLKEEGVYINAETERLTPEFFKKVLEKYGGVTAATHPIEPVEEPPEDANKAVPEPMLKRASTMPRKMLVRQSTADNVKHVPDDKEKPKAKQPSLPKKADTLPVSLTAKLTTHELDVELKSDNIVSSIKAQIQSKDVTQSTKITAETSSTGQIVKTSTTITFDVPRPGNDQPEVNTTDLSNASVVSMVAATSAQQAILGGAFTSEPESSGLTAEDDIAAATEDAVSSSLAVTNTDPTPTAATQAISNDDEVVANAFRLMCYELLRRIPEDDAKATWSLAIVVTDAMVPGFLQRYVLQRYREGLNEPVV